MAIYSVNQNRQFYVVKAIVENLALKAKEGKANEGDAEVLKSKDGKQVWLNYFGKGGLTRTDLIDVDKVCYAQKLPAEEMIRELKKAVVTLNPDYLVDGNPISGQDYVLRVHINNYLAPGDASVLIKTAAVHGVKGMTAKTFYEKMADSLTKSFSREPQPLLKFKGDANGVTISEVPQPWRLGVLSQEPVNFEVYATTIKYDGEDVIWATLNDKGFIAIEDSGVSLGNGKQIADLEYFCMAERGDMFRNMGWPNNIDVKYMVDPEESYSLIDMHYYFSGSGVQVHKSEKDITFACPETGGVIDDLENKFIAAGIEVKG